MDIGPQYAPDDAFKARARQHQSRYRAEVLRVDFDDYGSRLTEADARALLNYYDGLGVRDALRRRFPAFSKKRDADMLRSEHIPFNLFAPLSMQPKLLRKLLIEHAEVEILSPEVRIEWAPSPASEYLGDKTSFDAYVWGLDGKGRRVGVGVEVKYTEQQYRPGASELARVRDSKSAYWTVTRASGAFRDPAAEALGDDRLRQFWRDHLLGLAMVQRGDLERFVTMTIYPSGNRHIKDALAAYQTHATASAAPGVVGLTYERLIDSLPTEGELGGWREFLRSRYVPAEPPPWST